MYGLLISEDVYLILGLCIIFAFACCLFEFIVVGFVDFVKSFVTKVNKQRVINTDSEKGSFDLYTRWRSRIRKNVFKHNG